MTSSGENSKYGSGSGGSIYIKSRSFRGTGDLLCKGGQSELGGGGSGGRISLKIKESKIEYVGTYSALGGKGISRWR